MLMSLENVLDGLTPIKTLIKHLTRVKVSNLLVTFFDGIDISDYGNKHQDILELKKI